MYVRLGKRSIKYSNAVIDDFMIFAEVLDTDMTYERPKLVRTKEELDIWFGKTFAERNYLDELLQQGITLFLYKPVSDGTNKNQSDYIDYSDWPETELYFKIPDSTHLVSLDGTEIDPAEDPEKIYHIHSLTGRYNDETYRYSKSIYTEDFGLIDIHLLPQTDNTSNTGSFNNRDTLRLYTSSCSIPYSHYKYYESEKLNLQDLDLTNLDLEQVDLGYQTLVFDINLNGTPSTSQFMIIRDMEGNDRLIHANGEGEEPTELPIYGGTSKTLSDYYTGSPISGVTEKNIISTLEQLGYTYKDNKIYSKIPVPVTYFTTMAGIQLTPNFEETHNLISQYYEEYKRVDFYSKTLGTDGPDSNINLIISKISEDYYNIEISRFDYTESFEGSILGNEYERLDYLISKYSNLISCNINVISGNSDLPTGTFTLKGAVKESSDYSPKMYCHALDIMLGYGDPVYPDYLLIPDPLKFGETITDSDYLTQYTKTILPYAEEVDCQVLIHNDSTTYKWNYTGDNNNRLIYFYGDIWINGIWRPSWYLFIIGLFNDIYSFSTSNVYYISPTDGDNPYDPETTTFINKLESKKSNYLIDNGHQYYYKEYQNGDNPTTSIWMRFVLSKVKRELEKNKWYYLSEKMVGTLKTVVERIVQRVASSFGIIRELTILDIQFNYTQSAMGVRLDISISDIVSDHITVDVVVNYNKQN